MRDVVGSSAIRGPAMYGETSKNVPILVSNCVVPTVVMNRARPMTEKSVVYGIGFLRVLM